MFHFVENIKGFRIYNKALSEREIAIIYRLERINFAPWYKRLWLSLVDVWLILIGK